MKVSAIRYTCYRIKINTRLLFELIQYKQNKLVYISHIYMHLHTHMHIPFNYVYRGPSSDLVQQETLS